MLLLHKLQRTFVLLAGIVLLVPQLAFAVTTTTEPTGCLSLGPSQQFPNLKATYLGSIMLINGENIPVSLKFTDVAKFTGSNNASSQAIYLLSGTITYNSNQVTTLDSSRSWCTMKEGKVVGIQLQTDEIAGAFLTASPYFVTDKDVLMIHDFKGYIPVGVGGVKSGLLAK